MRQTQLYTFRHACYSLVMTIALLWATISLPFVFHVQQEISKEKAARGATHCPMEEENNPFSNATEEKAGSINFSEEFLHHAEDPDFNDDKLEHDHRHSYDIYIAFHGELISPPPDSFLS